MSEPVTTVPAGNAQAVQEPWRRRFLRGLLYGKQVDRTAKAKARIPGVPKMSPFVKVAGISGQPIAGRLDCVSS